MGGVRALVCGPLVVGLGVGLGLLTNRFAADALPAAEAAPVVVESAPPAESARAARQRTFAGVLVASKTADLRAPFSGRVASVAVELSEVVEADAPLARLDPKRRGLERDVARASARSGKATLRRAEENRRAAELDVERTRVLHARGVASDAALDEAETALTVAALDVREARASLERGEAEVSVLEFDAADATVAAPFAGTVVGRYVEPGDRIREGEPMLRLADVTQRVVRFGVSEDQLDDVHVGGRIDVRGLYGEQVVRATVDRIAAEVDPTARLAIAEATLDTTPGHWPVGMTLQVRILSQPGENHE